MSKNRHHRIPPPPPAAQEIVKPLVPKHRQCPRCYAGQGGVGKRRWWKRKSANVVHTCYECNVCGHDWTAMIRTVTSLERIEWNEVEVQHTDLDLETR